MATIPLSVTPGTDITTALQNASTQAGLGGTVILPAGSFKYSKAITLNGVTLTGAGPGGAAGTVLIAQVPSNEALTVSGNGGGVQNLEIIGNNSAGRLSVPSGCAIDISGASNYLIENVLINGGATGGIMQRDNANHGIVRNNTIMNTQADAITNIGGSHDNLVTGNRIDQTGNTTVNQDDGISVVSYDDPSKPNGGLVYNITETGNTILLNPRIGMTHGRGLSVVGGQNIIISGNYVSGTPLAGIYVAAEPAYGTLGVNGVTASGNTLVSTGGDQGAVTIYNGEASQTITGVSVTANQLINPGYVAFQFPGGSTGPVTASIINNQIYDPSANGVVSTEFDLGGQPHLTQSGNYLVPTYPALLVSPGGGASTGGGGVVTPEVLSLVLSTSNIKSKPTFIAKIDGQQVGTGVVSATYPNKTQTFNFMLNELAGSHSVEIDFSSVSRQQRATLYVDQVSYAGVNCLGTPTPLSVGGHLTIGVVQ